MGRGKVLLKRIENTTNRQVTFAKRRNGLLKKAYELSVLCDAEVALLIFSNRGKLFEFCSGSSMAQIIEKYQRCSYGVLDASQPGKDTQSAYQEYLKLKAEAEALQHSQRRILGEDLKDLETKELDQLEHQVDLTLKHVRLTKTRCMLDQLSELRKKEESLLETNEALRNKLEETNEALRSSWEGRQQSTIPSTSQTDPSPEGHVNFLQRNSSLQLGINIPGDELDVTTELQNNVNRFIDGWMI